MKGIVYINRSPIVVPSSCIIKITFTMNKCQLFICSAFHTDGIVKRIGKGVIIIIWIWYSLHSTSCDIGCADATAETEVMVVGSHSDICSSQSNKLELGVSRKGIACQISSRIGSSSGCSRAIGRAIRIKFHNSSRTRVGGVNRSSNTDEVSFISHVGIQVISIVHCGCKPCLCPHGLKLHFVAILIGCDKCNLTLSRNDACSINVLAGIGRSAHLNAETAA